MGEPLLNANQKRRVATILRLLKENLEEVRSWREMERPGEPYATIRGSVDEILASVEEVRTVLALPAHQPPSLSRRVGATAEVWAISAEDMRAASLRGYGKVHPDLGRVLDGRVDAIVQQLRSLAALAGGLPER
jgi:hypothetical protein